MKIVINKTRAAIYAGGKLLIPGTNVLEDDGIDENKDDMKSFIEGVSVVVKDAKNMTAEDKKDAVGNINDRGNLKKLKEAVKGIDTAPAEQKLSKFDDMLKKAL